MFFSTSSKNNRALRRFGGPNNFGDSKVKMYSHLHVCIRMAGQFMSEKFYELMMSQLAGKAT